MKSVIFFIFEVSRYLSTAYCAMIGWKIKERLTAICVGTLPTKSEVITV